MTFREAKDKWNANMPNVKPEVIDGFPTGNVYVGMTHEDMESFDKFFNQSDEPTSITWHKFPDEQPPHDGWYLVTFRDADGRLCTGMVDVLAIGKREAEIITAWAEMPKPYEEE